MTGGETHPKQNAAPTGAEPDHVRQGHLQLRVGKAALGFDCGHWTERGLIQLDQQDLAQAHQSQVAARGLDSKHLDPRRPLSPWQYGQHDTLRI